MNKNTRLIIIIGCIVTFLVVPGVTILILSKGNKKEMAQPQATDTNLPTRSNEDLTKAIIDAHSKLTSGGQATFVITTTKKLKDGWYVVTIRDKSDSEGTNPAKLLLHDSSNGLSTILGPGTSFEPEITESVGVPTEISEELNQ